MTWDKKNESKSQKKTTTCEGEKEGNVLEQELSFRGQWGGTVAVTRRKAIKGRERQEQGGKKANRWGRR